MNVQCKDIVVREVLPISISKMRDRIYKLMVPIFKYLLGKWTPTVYVSYYTSVCPIFVFTFLNT